MKNNIILLLYLLILPFLLIAQGTVISNFGSNPGNLNAYKYVPANMPTNAPLVVVIHGCTQNAAGFASETGWNTLADVHKFYVVHAEQKSANNSNSCFNYWEPGDHSRGQGEALSIKQMTDYMKSNYNIDNARVFATGLSAGGAMTIVMLSTYPEIFAAGAEMAGLPYKVALSSLEVYLAAVGSVSKSAQQWGDLVRAQNPNYTGAYPRLSVFHGTSDIVINKNNATESIKQFTNLHNTDQNSDFLDNSFNGNADISYKQYWNAGGDVVVEYYSFNGMAHGIAVDPGSCYQQGGTAGGVAFDVNFYSSFWAAKFFNILQPPFTINGLSAVNINQQGITYSVSNNQGSTYSWQVPNGTSITSGQGTNSITVNWGSTSGNLMVTETRSNGCVYGPVELFITADAATIVENSNDANERVSIRIENGAVDYTVKSTTGNMFNIIILDITGKIIYRENNQNSNRHYLVNKSLLPGVYVMNCVSANNKLVKKFVLN